MAGTRQVCSCGDVAIVSEGTRYDADGRWRCRSIGCDAWCAVYAISSGTDSQPRRDLQGLPASSRKIVQAAFAQEQRSSLAAARSAKHNYSSKANAPSAAKRVPGRADEKVTSHRKDTPRPRYSRHARAVDDKVWPKLYFPDKSSRRVVPIVNGVRLVPPAQLFWYCAHDASCDAAAALAAGFQPSCPSLSETKVFANLGTVSLSGNYLEARNHVLIQWTSDVTHYLTIDSCLKHIPPASHILVTRVYDFLRPMVTSM